jgi:hypothetical protein
MIAVAHEEVLDELRGVRGNDVAVKDYAARREAAPWRDSNRLRRPRKPLPRLSPKVDL